MNLFRSAAILTLLVATLISGCTPTPQKQPSTLALVREAACLGQHNTVLTYTRTDESDPTTAIILGRYRVLALHSLGRQDEFAQELIVVRKREAQFEGPLPVEMGLDYGEVAFWISTDPTVDRLYRDLAHWLDTHAAQQAPQNPEPETTTIVGCASRPRRTLAQAQALARLRLGTIAANNGKLGVAEAEFAVGINTLQRAGQIPDEFQGRSFSALLYNNWSEVLLRYGDSAAQAMDKRLIAYRLADQANATDTLGLVSAGLAFLGGTVTESGGGWAPYLIASCIAEQRIHDVAFAQTSPPSPSVLATLAKMLAVRDYYESLVFGPLVTPRSDARHIVAELWADQSNVLAAQQFVGFYRASALDAQGRWAEASLSYREFLESLAALWTTQADTDFQQGLFWNVQHWVEKTMSTALFHGDVSLLFSAMERSKDIGLLRRYTWGKTNAASATTAQLQQKTDARWSVGSQLLSDAVDLDVVAKSLLHPDEALIQFDLLTDPPTLVTVIVTQNGANAVTSPSADLMERVHRYRQSLIHPDGQESTDAIAQHLYDRLITPVIPHITGTPIRRLILIPRGELHSLPWATLRTENTYLIEQYVLSLVPSATFLQQLRSESRPSLQANPTPLALVMGSHFSADNEDSLMGLVDPKESTPIFRTAQDVKRGLSATIVHIKAHAVYDPNVPAESYLRLSPYQNHDGRLSLKELAQTPLSADTIVLQSCETARTEAAPGDQMDSFARVFLSAGANSVIAPLWELPESVSQIMAVRFYRYVLQEKMDPAVALQQVQWDMLRGELGVEAQKPSAWGIYSITGNPQPRK